MLLALGFVGCGDELPDEPAPSSCEEVVDRAEDCPTLNELCDPLCRTGEPVRASHECCYPREVDGELEWGIIFTDCFCN